MFAVAKKMSYQDMHKQQFNGKSTVTGLKGIGEQAILPFLETQALKCRFKLKVYTIICIDTTAVSCYAPKNISLHRTQIEPQKI